MQYIDPKVTTLSITYDTVTYTHDYYNVPTIMTGVVDEAHPDWAVGTVFGVGDYCIVPELKRIFRSTKAANTGEFPLDINNLDVSWVDYGTINSYKAFSTDSDIGSQTTGTDGVLEFDFSQSNSIVGVDLNFITAEILLIKTDGINYLSDYVAGTTYAVDDAVIEGNALYISLQAGNIGNLPSTSPAQWIVNTDRIYFDEQIDGKDIGCSTYGEYFYTSAVPLSRKVLTGLTWLPESNLRIKLNGAFKLGTIGYNNIREFGATIVESKLRYQSSSKIKTNEFTGFRTVLRFGTVRLLDVDIIFDEELFGQTSQTVSELIDKNIVWIPTTVDKFTEAISIGYIEDFELPMNVNTKFKTTARIIGVSK